LCGRSATGDGRVHQVTTEWNGGRARPAGGLRGGRAPLSRIVVGPGTSLAAFDRAVDHGLRRPRSPRRLEHLGFVDRGDARATLVAGADHRGVRGVLRLSTPREPLTTRARSRITFSRAAE